MRCCPRLSLPLKSCYFPGKTNYRPVMHSTIAFPPKEKKTNPNTKQRPRFGSLMVYNCVFNGGGGMRGRYLRCDEPVLSLWERKHQEYQYILCVDFQQSVTCVWGNELRGGYFPYYGFDMNLAPGPGECDECIIWSSCLCLPLWGVSERPFSRDSQHAVSARH